MIERIELLAVAVALAGCAPRDTPERVSVPVGGGELVLSVDVSHWSGSVTEQEAECFYQSGIRHVIAGTQDPDITRQQLEVAVDCGHTVDAYVYLYWHRSLVDQVGEALDTVDGIPVGRLWLDIEDAPPASVSIDDLELRIAEALDACGTYRCGIYTGEWWWSLYLDDSDAFAHVPLWYAFYDHVASLETWPGNAFGGWAQPTGKQYRGSSSLCGVTVDRNIIWVADEAELDGSAVAAAPGGLAPDGAVITSTSVVLSSSAIHAGNQYEFEIWVDGETGAQLDQLLTASEPAAELTVQRNMADYLWRVRGQNAAGWTAWSDWARFTAEVPEGGDGPPPAPGDLSPPDGSTQSGQVVLSCGPIFDASGYEFGVEYWNGVEYRPYYTFAAVSPHRSFWPSAAFSRYRWRVRARNGHGTGVWSPWVTFYLGAA